MAIEDSIILSDGTFWDVSAWAKRVNALGGAIPAGTDPEPIRTANGETILFGHALARLKVRDGQNHVVGKPGGHCIRIGFGPLYDVNSLEARLRAADGGATTFIGSLMARLSRVADAFPKSRPY